MSATVEVMLERRFQLNRSQSHRVVVAAKSNLGLGRNVLYSTKLMSECQRVAEAKGYIKGGKALQFTRQFSFNTLPAKPNRVSSDGCDELTCQSNHETSHQTRSRQQYAPTNVLKSSKMKKTSKDSSYAEKTNNPAEDLDETKNQTEKIELFDGFFLEMPVHVFSDNAKIPSPNLLLHIRRNNHSNMLKPINSPLSRKDKILSRTHSSGTPTSRWESIPKTNNGVSHQVHPMNKIGMDDLSLLPPVRRSCALRDRFFETKEIQRGRRVDRPITLPGRKLYSTQSSQESKKQSMNSEKTSTIHIRRSHHGRSFPERPYTKRSMSLSTGLAYKV